MSALKCIYLICILMVLCVSFAGASSDIAEFKYCIRQVHQPGLRECAGRTVISFLQRFDEAENFTLVDGFVTAKDDKIAGRSLVNMLDTDPVDFRGILENAGAVIGQRSLEWHMDGFYPGLMLKIGPTADVNSVMEFVLDPAADERNLGYASEPSTARVLAKQYLLPFLLGLKFNLVALVPLIFAGVLLLLKKSLFLAKLAIYVSSLLGVGGALGALGSLGGFGSFGGGLGGLGGIGGLGGLGGLGGGVGGILRPHGHSLSEGYFPGKATVFNYEADELNHNSPYKRNDRKLTFNRPREEVANVPVETTAATDRFYDYEKKLLVHDRNAKLRTNNRKLSARGFEADEVHFSENFKPSDQLGWKVIDSRS